MGPNHFNLDFYTQNFMSKVFPETYKVLTSKDGIIQGVSSLKAKNMHFFFRSELLQIWANYKKICRQNFEWILREVNAIEVECIG